MNFWVFTFSIMWVLERFKFLITKCLSICLNRSKEIRKNTWNKLQNNKNFEFWWWFMLICWFASFCVLLLLIHIYSFNMALHFVYRALFCCWLWYCESTIAFNKQIRLLLLSLLLFCFLLHLLWKKEKIGTNATVTNHMSFIVSSFDLLQFHSLNWRPN